MRAVGAMRRQVLASVVLEALLVGLVASVAGLFGGLAIAGLLKGLFDSFGFALPAGGLVFKGSTALPVFQEFQDVRKPPTAKVLNTP